MVRNYKKKGTRTQDVDEDSMKLAIDDVIKGRLSFRKAALKYNIKTSTLQSRVRKFKAGNGDKPSRVYHSKFTSLQVFSLEEEARLNDYLTNCSKMHYGLTEVEIRKLAYKYAKALKLRYPAKWNENRMAGLEWMRRYRERNSDVSLRQLKKTSTSRSKPEDIATSTPISPVLTTSILQTPEDDNTGTCEPTTSAAEIQPEPNITPEAIRPSPTVVKNRKTNQGRKPDESRTCTDAPEENKQEESYRQKESEVLEQERNARAKAMERNSEEINPGQKKIDSDVDSEDSEETLISLRESSTSPVDFDIDDDASDCNIGVIPEKIEDDCCVLVKFEKKPSALLFWPRDRTYYPP